MALLMNLTFAATALSAALLVALLAVYARNLRSTPSTFTGGLVLFAAVLLLENLFAIYHYATMMPLYAAGLEPYTFSLSVLELVAFAALTWVTYK